MKSTVLVLLALAAGLGLGMLASGDAPPALRALPLLVAPIGTLFVNAIRMTVVPLVVAKLVVGVAARAGDSSVARLATLALAGFAALLIVAAAYSAVVTVPAFAALPIDASVARSIREGAGGAVAEAPALSLRQFVEGLIPANPIAAAADAAMLPLIVFAVMLGLALGRVPAASREVVLRFFDGLGEAMLAIVRWVLVLAPVGVFALTVPVVARLGVAAVSALAGYVALVAVVTVSFAVFVLYPLGVIVGRVRLRRLAREIAPAQAIAFSSRSSLASLPVMIDQGVRLDLPPSIVGFFLPLAASVFRVGSVMGTTIGALFVARLHGVDLPAAAVVTIVATAVLVGLGSPGVPSGSILVIVPILTSVGLPAEGVGVLLGIDPIPDMFRTATNITGNMSLACVLGRATKEGPAS